LVIPKDTLAQLEKDQGPFHARPVASVKGINYSRGKEIEILAISRTLP
jgi:hypothetical protein